MRERAQQGFAYYYYLDWSGACDGLDLSVFFRGSEGRKEGHLCGGNCVM